MKLSEKQQKFTQMVARLIIYAESLGYGLTFGDAYATTGHKKKSFHYSRLAVDFNLFIDGEYQESTAAHQPLGLYWERIGGTWGGKFDSPDGNHYSYGE